MRIHYFQSAWEDIKHTRGWFGKILLLALVNFIPILGQIIILSYLYGWAREIAWGIHEPAPAKIIANDDGKFWWRGWLIAVLTVAFLALPTLLNLLSGSIDAYSYEWTIFGPQLVSDPGLSALKTVLSLLAFAAGLVLLVFSWVGCMRVAIYNRLSAGFQFKKMWAMLRHDGAGMGRIFLMNLLLVLIMGCIMAVVVALFIGIVLTVGISAAGGLQNLAMIAQMDSSQGILVAIQVLLAAGGVGFILLLIVLYLGGIASVFMHMVVIRALGYWTMQFEVPLWGGQDDPLPFELQEPPEAARASAPEAPAPPAAPAAVASPAAAAPVAAPVPATPASVAPAEAAAAAIASAPRDFAAPNPSAEDETVVPLVDTAAIKEDVRVVEAEEPARAPEPAPMPMPATEAPVFPLAGEAEAGACEAPEASDER